MAVEVVENGNSEAGVGEGGCFIAEPGDGAVTVGCVSGVEISCSAGECGDVAGVEFSAS